MRTNRASPYSPGEHDMEVFYSRNIDMLHWVKIRDKKPREDEPFRTFPIRE